MTSALQNSLHALSTAARKGMVPDEVVMHLEQITNEISALEKRAAIRGELSNLTIPVEGAGVKDWSGNAGTGRVEIRGSLAPVIEILAENYQRGSDRAKEMYAVTYLAGKMELAEIIKNYGMTAELCALSLLELAKKK